jgi:hypothetical protein
VVNAGSVASPATTWAPAKSPRPLPLTVTTSWPLGDELGDEEVAELASAEDDVAAHELLLSVLVGRVDRTRGRTEVSAATVTAP